MNRNFIRHPVDIPIVVTQASKIEESLVDVSNISEGGLRCFVPNRIALGSLVKVCIPVLVPPYNGEGIVVWCNLSEKGYELGIRFINDDESFRLKMVEQICRIERYRKKQQEQGYFLSAEEAAQEWIEKNAEQFHDDDAF